MIAREKAKELVEWYEVNINGNYRKGSYSDEGKKCAIKIVDEILLWDCNERGTIDENVEYCNDVKREIKLL